MICETGSQSYHRYTNTQNTLTHTQHSVFFFFITETLTHPTLCIPGSGVVLRDLEDESGSVRQIQ